MLQLIHSFKKTIFAVIFLFLAGLSLAGLGIGSSQFGGHGNDPQNVATVNGEPITYTELSRARNNDQIPAQQALDTLVDRTVIRMFSERAGLAAGEGAVRQMLQDIAPGGMTAEGLREMLSNLRMTAVELEHEIQQESVSRQLYAAISASISPSKLEIDQGIKNFETIKTVSLASLNNDSLISQTAMPKEEQIEQYYREQTSDFEVPPAVAYDYVVFAPERYKDSVVVTDEDVELYYADHQKEFAVPGSIEAKQIRMLYPKGAKPEAINEIKERAQQAYARAKAGENFDGLVLEFSDDIASKMLGGNLGTVTRGKLSPEFDAAVFKLREPGLAELIEADYGFQIVKVTAVHPDSVKPLADVKDEIRSKIQQVDAPAYASARAGELYADWQKVGGTLAEFSSSRGLGVASTTGLLTAAKDPSTELKGITAAILAAGDNAHQQVELANESVLVDVTGRRETEVASLDSVRAQIVKTLQTREAASILRKKADELSKVQVAANFEKAAKELGFTVKSGIELKSQDRTPNAELNKGDLAVKVKRLNSLGTTTPTFAGDMAYVASVIAIKADPNVTPEQHKANGQMVAQQIQYELGSLIEKSLLADEKRTAKIEIKGGVYSEE